MKTFWALPLLLAAGVFAAETNRPPARPGLEIKADFSIFDLKGNTAYYSNNVVLIDPPAKPGDAPTILHCRELTARRSLSNKLDNIVAFGKVMIDQGEMHARGERAVYTATNELMVLTGGFDADHPMPELYSPAQGTLTGDVIIYDRVNGRLSATNVTTTISSAALTNSSPASTNKPRVPKTPAGQPNLLN